MSSPADEAAGHAAWRAARRAELAGPDSWLGVVGLHWLAEGTSVLGSGPACTVVLPRGPEVLGELERSGGQVVWRARGEAPRGLTTDRDGEPDVLTADSLALLVIEREGRLALRVRDRAWAAGRAFVPPPCYPFDPAWRIAARWVALPEPRAMELPDVNGELRSVRVAFEAVFELGGQTLRLLPVWVRDDGVFFVFRDRSSGRETYGAGRFLMAPVADGGVLVLDFNRAYNPPCAFTPFATCPLPPPENWLPVAVPAGEMKPHAGEAATHS
ncbi:MAG: DUF1684 domain-containing protein [Dechloromonas sp.]|nr:DUF1684 domain-containing protein [Dechloromonas sp.]